MKHKVSKQSGFTVLEVVIAFAILSVVTIVSVGVVTQNTIRVNKIEKHFMAIEVVETALAEITGNIASVKLITGEKRSGKSGADYYWEATINKYKALGGDYLPVLPLWKIDLSVFYKKSKKSMFNFSTIVPGK
jgi:type II secretory pathway pseudopilin PulG